MNEFYQYLMNEMASEINTTWEEKSHRAHELCFLLSVDGQPLPETFFRLYAANVDTEYNKIYNAVAFFSGMGLLDVQCDCEHEYKNSCDLLDIPESEFFDYGQACMTSHNKVWFDLMQDIVKIREACVLD